MNVPGRVEAVAEEVKKITGEAIELVSRSRGFFVTPAQRCAPMTQLIGDAAEALGDSQLHEKTWWIGFHSLRQDTSTSAASAEDVEGLRKVLLDHAEPVDPPGDMMHIANPNPLELERAHARVLHPDVSGLVFIVHEEDDLKGEGAQRVYQDQVDLLWDELHSRGVPQGLIVGMGDADELQDVEHGIANNIPVVAIAGLGGMAQWLAINTLKEKAHGLYKAKQYPVAVDTFRLAVAISDWPRSRPEVLPQCAMGHGHKQYANIVSDCDKAASRIEIRHSRDREKVERLKLKNRQGTEQDGAELDQQSSLSTPRTHGRRLLDVGQEIYVYGFGRGVVEEDDSCRTFCRRAFRCEDDIHEKGRLCMVCLCAIRAKRCDDECCPCCASCQKGFSQPKVPADRAVAVINDGGKYHDKRKKLRKLNPWENPWSTNTHDMLRLRDEARMFGEAGEAEGHVDESVEVDAAESFQVIREERLTRKVRVVTIGDPRAEHAGGSHPSSDMAKGLADIVGLFQPTIMDSGSERQENARAILNAYRDIATLRKAQRNQKVKGDVIQFCLLLAQFLTILVVQIKFAYPDFGGADEERERAMNRVITWLPVRNLD